MAPVPGTPHADDVMRRITDEEFDRENLPPHIDQVWRPRFREVGRAFLRWEADRAPDIRKTYTELPAGYELTEAGIRLSGIADRIDIKGSGDADIIDYKTGLNPSPAQARALLDPQLALEAAALQAGAFKALGAQRPDNLLYVRLRPGERFTCDKVNNEGARATTTTQPKSAIELAADSITQLTTLVKRLRDNSVGFASRVIPVMQSDFAGTMTISPVSPNGQRPMPRMVMPMTEITLETLGNDPHQWLTWTAQQQALASDPDSSAWVSANAGSGKTHVLTQRVIRLLLAGCRPSAILCLTYTKAAASEMSNRVFQRLAEWAVLPDEELAKRITAIEGHEPDSLKLADARRLFAKALETPGGLKIQTIHAFCEALLHQFPLEANVAGHFSVLDDVSASALLAEARRSLLTATAIEEDSGLAEAFAHVLDLGDETGLEGLLSDIVANRTAIRRFLGEADDRGGVEAVLTRAFGLQPGETETSVLAAYLAVEGSTGFSSHHLSRGGGCQGWRQGRRGRICPAASG